MITHRNTIPLDKVSQEGLIAMGASQKQGFMSMCINLYPVRKQLSFDGNGYQPKTGATKKKTGATNRFDGYKSTVNVVIANHVELFSM